MGLQKGRQRNNYKAKGLVASIEFKDTSSGKSLKKGSPGKKLIVNSYSCQESTKNKGRIFTLKLILRLYGLEEKTAKSRAVFLLK